MLSTCSSANLDTTLDKGLTTYHAILNYTTTAYQSRSLRDSNTTHSLALQFPHPTNETGKRESNSLLVTPISDRFWQSSNLVSSLTEPTRKQWRVENYFVVKNFSWVSIIHEIFLVLTYFSTKIYQTTVYCR